MELSRWSRWGLIAVRMSGSNGRSFLPGIEKSKSMTTRDHLSRIACAWSTSDYPLLIWTRKNCQRIPPGTLNIYLILGNVTDTGSSIYIGPFLNDSPFLSQSTQEKVMHFFRKPWILAIGSNYETKSKYVMGGSKWVLVNLEEFCFLHWILITSHFYAN